MATSTIPYGAQDCHALSSAQQQVIALLSEGSSISAAAEAAGIHRNTIANWRRSSDAFHRALVQAQHDKLIFWSEQAEALAPAALETVRTLLTDPATPPAVRLKAALHILERACIPPPDTELHNPHNFAQVPVHNFPKIGRNQPCPCGSGKKFKRCCQAKFPALPDSAAPRLGGEHLSP